MSLFGCLVFSLFARLLTYFGINYYETPEANFHGNFITSRTKNPLFKNNNSTILKNQQMLDGPQKQKARDRFPDGAHRRHRPRKNRSLEEEKRRWKECFNTHHPPVHTKQQESCTHTHTLPLQSRYQISYMCRHSHSFGFHLISVEEER